MQVLDANRRILSDRLGAERLRRNRFGHGRSRRLPGGHHAGVRARGRVQVLKFVRPRGQVDIALDPGIVDRPVPAGGGDDEFAVDQQEAAILARGEEPVQPRPGNPQRSLVLTQKRFGIRPERIVPVEHGGNERTAKRLGRLEGIAQGIQAPQVAVRPVPGFQEQTGPIGPGGRLFRLALARVVELVQVLLGNGTVWKASRQKSPGPS